MSIGGPLGADSPSIVRLPAEVDFGSAAEVRDSLLATVNRGGAHLVVDARGVSLMDSSGVNALVRARERTELLGGSLHVVADTRPVRRVIELTQLTRVLHMVGTMDEALRCLARPEQMHTCEPADPADPPEVRRGGARDAAPGA